MVTNLQKKQKGLQNEINKKRREANQLNARIDKLIAEEIERARKRAQEEARREAAARKKEESKEGKSTATETAAKSKPLDAYTISRRIGNYRVTLLLTAENCQCLYPELISLPAVTDNMP